VRAHYGVDFAFVDVEADAFKDRFIFDSGVEVLDAEHRCSVSGVRTPVLTPNYRSKLTKKSSMPSGVWKTLLWEPMKEWIRTSWALRVMGTLVAGCCIFTGWSLAPEWRGLLDFNLFGSISAPSR